MVDDLYDAIGGEPTFRRLIDGFYARIATDPVLRPLYPDDLSEPAENLHLFLVQYFGGPRDYHIKRGHPRLRQRHAPFTIGERERDAWLAHMRASLDDLALDATYDERLWSYLQWAADTMVNSEPAEPDRSLPITDQSRTSRR